MSSRHLFDDTSPYLPANQDTHASNASIDSPTEFQQSNALGIDENSVLHINGNMEIDDLSVEHGNPFRSSTSAPNSPKTKQNYTFNKRKAAVQADTLRVDVPTDVDGPTFSTLTPGTAGFQRRYSTRNMDQYDPHTIEFALESVGRRVAYGNFSTIDWIHDAAKERVRLRKLASESGFRGSMLRMWDGLQAWILVFLVGGVSGILAAWIDVAGEWLSDLKMGYCKEGFYLNRLFCCWHVHADDPCHQWVPWSVAMGAGMTGVGAGISSFFMYVLWAVFFAFVAAVLVKVYAPYAAGSGLAEVRTILGGFVIRKFLGVWTLVIKCIGLALSTASGLSLGKEGPLVHVACCVGNVLARLFPKYSKNEAKKREILSAAAAAGVSVAFGAPIGGVLFSLEEVSYYFPMKTLWRSFLCAMMGAIALQLMNPFRTGKLVMFQVTYNRDWHAFELPWFVLLGVMGGLYGAFFIKANVRWVAFRKNGWLKNYQVEEVTVVALITAIIGYAIIFLRVNMGELLANLFRECEEMETDFHGVCQKDRWGRTVALLLLSFVVKIILTVFTFGIRVPAGIFVPSMAIGATFGRALGIIVQHWQEAYPHLWIFSGCPPDSQCVTPGTYAMVGAAAALGGVTRMTVSLTVIMFEITGALSYVLPIMIALMVAKWVGDAIGKESIYAALIHLNGYPFLDNREEYIHSTLVSQVMTRQENMVVITAVGHTVDSLEDLLKHNEYKGFPVVESRESMLLVGYCGHAELAYALQLARSRQDIDGSSPCIFSEPESGQNVVDLRPWTDLTPFACGPKFPMELVIELFRKMGLKYILVTKDGRLQGMLTKKDLLRHSIWVNHPELHDALPRQDEASFQRARAAG